MSLRPDLAIIADNIARGTRVHDVGCGDGALMAALRDNRGVDARGLEIDAGNVAAPDIEHPRAARDIVGDDREVGAQAHGAAFSVAAMSAASRSI